MSREVYLVGRGSVLVPTITAVPRLKSPVVAAAEDTAPEKRTAIASWPPFRHDKSTAAHCSTGTAPRHITPTLSKDALPSFSPFFPMNIFRSFFSTSKPSPAAMADAAAKAQSYIDNNAVGTTLPTPGAEAFTDCPSSRLLQVVLPLLQEDQGHPRQSQGRL